MRLKRARAKQTAPSQTGRAIVKEQTSTIQTEEDGNCTQTGSRHTPAKQPKRSIMAILKKPEPLAKTAPAAPPRLVWTGRSNKVKLPAGTHIESWS